MSTIVATEDSLLFWGSRPLLQSTISCPISNHSNNSSKNSIIEPGTKKRSNSTNESSTISPWPVSSQRELKTSSSLPEDGLASQPKVDDDITVTSFLLQCKSVNDNNRSLISEGSQYGQFLTNILESIDAKKATPNMEMVTDVNDWKKVFLSSHEIQFCTENGVMLDTGASEIIKLKVEGIACYGCNLLVLTEGQVALTPTSTSNILAEPATEITAINDTMAAASSRTPFVMGRRLARQSVFRRIDSRFAHDVIFSKIMCYCDCHL